MTPALKVAGPHLVERDTGHRARLPGVSAFALFKRYLMQNGWDALVYPILVEWRQVAHDGGYEGPIVLRVFRNAAPPNAFALDPWSYDGAQVAAFTQRCGTLGFYVDWTSGDNQLCFPSADPRMGEHHGSIGMNQHANIFCAAIAHLPNVIWNTCNEPFKNGVDTDVTKPPPWAPVVQYSGNYDDLRDQTHDLACLNLHTDRNTESGAQKWVGKAHESAPYLWLRGKPIFYDEPMGADELTIPGRRSNVPHYFGIYGTVIAMVSAVYFHSTDGLACNGLRPITRQCAVEFFRGIAGGLKVTP
mgnify:FL=1